MSPFFSPSQQLGQSEPAQPAAVLDSPVEGGCLDSDNSICGARTQEGQVASRTFPSMPLRKVCLCIDLNAIFTFKERKHSLFNVGIGST